MVKINEEKLHRHGNARLSIRQKGDDISVTVDGNRYDILHMLMAVMKRHARLGRLFEQAVFFVLKDEFNDTDTPSEKKERRVN